MSCTSKTTSLGSPVVQNLAAHNTTEQSYSANPRRKTNAILHPPPKLEIHCSTKIQRRQNSPGLAPGRAARRDGGRRHGRPPPPTPTPLLLLAVPDCDLELEEDDDGIYIPSGPPRSFV
jgi:hypothetical protein